MSVQNPASTHRATATDSAARAETWLRRTLWANAAFSGLSGLVCAFDAAPLAGWLGAPAEQIASLGIELTLFSVFLGFLASRPSLRAPWVLATVAVIGVVDALWVVGSFALLASTSFLTTAGQWVVVAQAVVVADFAAFELVNWWRLRSTAVGLRPVEA